MSDYENAPSGGGYGAGPLTVPYDKAWAWPVEGVKKSSRNHEANAWTVEAARAALHGTREQFLAAQAVLMTAFYPKELSYGPGAGAGLWEREMLSPAAHTHQQVSSTSMGRVAAWHSQDAELLDVTGRLLRVTAVLFKALASPAPNYFMGAPGLRAPAPGRPGWWDGTAWLRQLMGLPGPMPEFKAKAGKPSLFLDRVALGVRALRYLHREGDDLAGARAVGEGGAGDPSWEETSNCKLKYGLTVYRGTDRHLAVIAKPKSGRDIPPDVCDWVEVPWLKTFKATSAGMRFGHNWTTEPPSPPPGAHVLHFPSWE